MVSLRDIWNAVNQLKAAVQAIPGATGGAGRTPNPVNIGANASGSIPAGVPYNFTALSGTVTLGGVTIPAGVTQNGGPLSAPLAYTTGANSSAYLYYES